MIRLLFLCLFFSLSLGAAEKSYVTQLTKDVYLYQHGFHSNIFVITDDGVIATDPISPRAAAACLKEIRKLTDQPVKYVIYSHDHTDHIAGGIVYKPAARFVAHRNAHKVILARQNPDIIAPDILVDDSHTIELGGKTLELAYHGRIESSSSLTLYLPEDKVLMWVDTVRSHGVPYRYLEGTDLRDFRQALKKLQTLDIDHIVHGHGAATDKARLMLYSHYFDDLEKYSIEEMTKHSRLDHRAHSKGLNPEKHFDTYIAEIAGLVLERMRKNYGQLGAFDDWGPKNAERMVVFLLHDIAFDY